MRRPHHPPPSTTRQTTHRGETFTTCPPAARWLPSVFRPAGRTPLVPTSCKRLSCCSSPPPLLLPQSPERTTRPSSPQKAGAAPLTFPRPPYTPIPPPPAPSSGLLLGAPPPQHPSLPAPRQCSPLTQVSSCLGGARGAPRVRLGVLFMCFHQSAFRGAGMHAPHPIIHAELLRQLPDPLTRAEPLSTAALLLLRAPQ